MARTVLKVLLVIFTALLAAELIFLGVMHFTGADDEPTGPARPSEATTLPEETEEPTEIPTTAAPTTEPTTAPTETEPTETEPQEIRYTLTFVGDCTLGSEPGLFASPYSFIGTIGEDYGYPFRNVLNYFENDDFTLINLEGVFADSGYGADKRFTFRGPTEYTQILTGSSVEAVTLANNHSMDFGKEGYDSTVKALEDAGVAYVEENKTKLVTTESGLVIGLYADAFQFSKSDIQKNIAQLKDDGAEIIICAFHWGTEGSYRATGTQESFAKAAIDAGAHIVYGHHPHVLQKIEEYNGGVICYSLGNFSFGGNNYPRDLDSAVVQQEVIRDIDGTVSLGEMTIIPVSISSMKVQNNFQPTPYEEGSAEYDRVLSKLDGSFTGPDLVVNYEKPTEPPTEAPTDATEPSAPATGDGSTQPPATQPEQGGDVVTEPNESGNEVTEPAESGDEAAPPPTQGGEAAPAPTQGSSDSSGDSAGTGDSAGEAAPPAAGEGDSSAEG